jgi:hypothetical protein
MLLFTCDNALVQDDDVIIQICVIHEDHYMRTYTVNDPRFELLDHDPDLHKPQDLQPRATQCYVEPSVHTYKQMKKARLLLF